MQINRLLDSVKVNESDPMLKDCLPQEVLVGNLLHFFFTTGYRKIFSQKEYFKRNNPKYVKVKFLKVTARYGKSQFVSAFNYKKSVIEEFPEYLLGEYAEVYSLVYKNAYRPNNLTVEEYAIKENIVPILNYYREKDFNQLFLNFYSLVFIAMGDWQIVDENKYWRSFLPYKFYFYYYQIYRGENGSMPVFYFQGQNKLVMYLKYGVLCGLINILVFFKKRGIS